jgi:hypothetical protein
VCVLCVCVCVFVCVSYGMETGLDSESGVEKWRGEEM